MYFQNEQIFLKDLSKLEKVLQQYLVKSPSQYAIDKSFLNKAEAIYVNLRNKQNKIHMLSNSYNNSRKRLSSLCCQKNQKKDFKRVSFDKANTFKYTNKIGLQTSKTKKYYNTQSLIMTNLKKPKNIQNFTLLQNKQESKKRLNKKIQFNKISKILTHKKLQKEVQQFILIQSKKVFKDETKKFCLSNFIDYCIKQGYDQKNFDLEFQKILQIYLDFKLKKQLQNDIKQQVQKQINYDEYQIFALQNLTQQYVDENNHKNQLKKEHFKNYSLNLKNLKINQNVKGFHQEFIEMAPYFSTSWRNEIKKLKKLQCKN